MADNKIEDVVDALPHVINDPIFDVDEYEERSIARTTLSQ
jgi:hypothetical protein